MTSHREPDPTLVTGASGYVGGFLIKELLKRDRRVRPAGEKLGDRYRARSHRHPPAYLRHSAAADQDARSA